MSTRDRFKNSIATFLQLPSERTQDESIQLSDLVSESFILIEMVIDLQEQYQIRLHQEDLNDVKTLGQLLDVLVQKHDHK